MLVVIYIFVMRVMNVDYVILGKMGVIRSILFFEN